jgi:hypothetical protein
MARPNPPARVLGVVDARCLVRERVRVVDACAFVGLCTPNVIIQGRFQCGRAR